MKKRKTTGERIRREFHRFLSRMPLLFGAFRTKRRWMTLLSEAVGEPVTDVAGRLYVLGDSHTNFFGGVEHIRFINVFEGVSTSPNLIPFIKTLHVGPATAYNLPHRDSQVQAMQKTAEIINRGLIPHGSLVLLCFGEIDCRVHLVKQAERQQRSLEEVADGIVKNYMDFIEGFRREGFQVACWGAIGTQKGGPNIKGEFPVYGSEVERNEASRIFNSILERECRLRNMRFCSIFDQLVDDQLETRSEYLSTDGCHLSQRATPLLAKALLESGLLRQRDGRVEVVAGGECVRRFIRDPWRGSVPAD